MQRSSELTYDTKGKPVADGELRIYLKRQGLRAFPFSEIDGHGMLDGGNAYAIIAGSKRTLIPMHRISEIQIKCNSEAFMEAMEVWKISHTHEYGPVQWHFDLVMGNTPFQVCKECGEMIDPRESEQDQ